MSEFICACGCPLDEEGFCPACDPADDVSQSICECEGAELPDPLRVGRSRCREVGGEGKPLSQSDTSCAVAHTSVG